MNDPIRARCAALGCSEEPANLNGIRGSDAGLAIERLPDSVREWGGEYEDTRDALLRHRAPTAAGARG